MEQDIVDASKYKISLINLDSRFAVQRDSRNGEFKIQLPKTLRNVMRIRMASAEIPLVAYTFSEYLGNTTFAVRLEEFGKFIKADPIPDGNYTLSQFVAKVQESLRKIHPGFTVRIDEFEGSTIIESTVPFDIYLQSYKKDIASRPANWGIGYNMGFRDCGVFQGVFEDGKYILQSESVCSVKPNPYYLLQLECPESVQNVLHPVLDDGFVNAFAKVILKGTEYTFQFDDNSNLVRKEFTYLAPHSIPFFTCRLINEWGQKVNMLDADWSVTIEITEVVNSKTHQLLSNTYARS